LKGKQGKSKAAAKQSNVGRYLLILIPLLVALGAIGIPWQRVNHYETILEKKLAAAENGVDSVTIEDEFNQEYGVDLQHAKDNSLKLGLDLRGGMYVTLEINLLELIKNNADVDLDDYVTEPEDSPFRQALKITEDELIANPNTDVINAFVENYNSVADGKSLTAYFTDDKFEESESKIIELLNKEADDAITSTQEIIRQRIDKYGVSEPNIQQQGERRILLELPGVKNEASVKELIKTTAHLDFHLVRSNDTIVAAFQAIDKMLSGRVNPVEDIVEAPEETPEVEEMATDEEAEATEELAAEEVVTEEVADSTVEEEVVAEEVADSTVEEEVVAEPAQTDEEAYAEYRQSHPFTTLFATTMPDQNIRNFDYNQTSIPSGDYAFYVVKNNLEKFLKLLESPEVNALIPIGYKVAVAAKPLPMSAAQEAEGADETFEFFCVLKENCFQPYGVTENIVTDANVDTDENNQPAVSMKMGTNAAKAWAKITGDNVNKRIAIILDDRIYSAPNVITQIIGGNSQITGMDNFEEANRLRIVLKSGRMKTSVNMIEERLVGPSLGEASINSGLNASLLAVFLVILFMIFYYARSGFVADYAVIVNVLLILALLTTMKGTLTLPGIAGIILTIGMAVDANVLIFERIREELRIGRSIRSAVDEGYRKALSAIIDANVTTAITAIILFMLGTGPIKGFATTVLIGIFCTLFTAILVTRAFVEITLSKGATGYNFGQPKLKGDK